MKHVYIMRGGENYYKVGVAVNVNSRLSSIRTSNPFKVELVATRFLENAEEAESAIHVRLREYRAEAQNEWFVLTQGQALQLVVDLAAHRQPAFLNQQVTTETLLARLDSEHSDNSSKLRSLSHVVETMSANLTALADQLKSFSQQQLEAAAPAKREADEPKSEPKHNQLIGDELAPTALNLLQKEGRASTSFLQRRLSIGYARAARIIDQLEAAGYIGPGDGANPREVFRPRVDPDSSAPQSPDGYPSWWFDPVGR